MARKLVILVMLLLFPLLALAQESTPEATANAAAAIVYGQSVDGTLTETTPTATYYFTGSAGDVVTITATSDNFDTFLTLRDAGGAELATDDDRAGNLNARIEAQALPAAGEYSITVSSYNRASTGEFTLTLEKVENSAGAPTAAALPTMVASPTDVAAEPTAAPASGTLAIGDSVTGTLTKESPAVDYVFEGSAGQTVTITLASTDFDAYLLLKDASGDTLASDDDGAGSYDARISAFSLPADGTYTISAGSYTNAETGAYTLSLDFASVRQTPVPTESALTATPTPFPPPTEAATEEPAAQAGNALAIGQTISGELTGGAPVTYTLEGRAGQLVTIRLVSEAFDSYLRLLSAAGAELATDDDSGGSLNAQIALYTLPQTGTYTVSVESFSGAGGAFTLSVQEVTPVPIEYTQTVQGTLAAHMPAPVYRFTGQAGDVVAISAEASDFDAYLTLSRPNAGALAEDDDSGGNLNPLIGPYTLPTTGDYYLSLRSVDSRSGAFRLSLLKATLTPIAYGDTLVGEFTPQTPALYYQFQAVAGDVVHIRVDSGGTLDTSLSLRGPDGYEVAFDDDSGEGSDPELNRQVLAQDGTYLLLIKPYDPTRTGRISLTLAREVLASLDAGKQQVQLNEKQPQDVLTFMGVAGERVWLAVRLLDSTSAAPTVTITQGGQTLTTANASAVAALTLEFVVPADGAVNVQVSDANFARVTLELTLERLGE
ncbi:MAG: PPC domain-containing protein [Chloroflexi bacterium]|nr:PPC domain-containing protein [Chloroflexota bacterium]